MQTVKIELEIPQDVLYSINKSNKELSKEIKKIFSIEMYKRGELSLGKCSMLVDLCKSDFIKLLYEKGVSLYNWDEEEINREIENVNTMIEEAKNENHN